MEIKAKKIVDMTQGSIVKSLIVYAIPIVVSDFLQQFYSSVDSIIVGKIEGKLALAAVGETFFIINIFLGCFLGISLGATVAISKSFGAKDFKKLSRSVDTTLKLGVILCGIFTVAGVLLVPSLLELVNTAPDVYADAKSYLTIYLGGISAQLMYNMLSGILKSIGDSRRPLYVLAITAVLNIGLDLLFVGPMHLGVAGAAYATVLAQLVSCIVLWIMINNTDMFEHPVIRKCGLDLEILKEILRVGVPYALQRAVISFSNTVVTSYVNYFGATTTAAWGIYNKIDQFVFGNMSSIGAAGTTFVSQNIGAGKIDRVKKGVNTALFLSIGISALYTGLVCVFRFKISSLFTDDEGVISMAEYFFIMMLLAHASNVFPQIYNGAMRALNGNVISTIILLSCMVGLRQAYLFIRWQNLKDITVVIAAYHLTWVACAVLCFVAYNYVYRRYRKEHEIKA